MAAVAVLGTAIRGVAALRGPSGSTSDRLALADQIARVDSALASGGRRPARATASLAGAIEATTDGPVRPSGPRRAGSGAARSSPLAGPVDVDRADSATLDLLPGIGPALAARIVADRELNGPFGSLDALQRVRGIGPALAKRLEPVVTFSAAGRRSSLEPLPPRVPARPIRP